MKTIKSVLEELVSQNGAELLADRLNHPSIDQALKEIESILDGAKPRLRIPSDTESLDVYYYKLIQEYRDNIKKVLK